MFRKYLAIAGLMMAAAVHSRGAEWKIEMVDQGAPGDFSSMKVDKEGNLHLAYTMVDGNRYPLRYSFWDHNVKRWFTMTVAEGAGSCTLALDSSQHPHIAYADWGGSSGGKLHYVSWNGSGWQSEPIQINADIIGYYSALALDGKDNPSISFYEYRGPLGTDLKIRLRVVAKRQGHWEVETVDPQEGSGKFNSMASDAAGHLFLAYANVGAGTAGMRFAYWDGKKWIREIVDGPEQNRGESLGFGSFVTLDRQGNPHVTYLNESTNQVRYAVKKNGRWQIHVLDRVSAYGALDRNAVALDDDNRAYVSYYDAGAGILKLAYQDGKNWLSEVVDSNGSGYTSSMQIDRGVIWISYADHVNGGIKVARREIAPALTGTAKAEPTRQSNAGQSK